MTEVEQNSLFDEDIYGLPAPELGMVKMEYLEAVRMNWRELFEGYNDIKVITFSSGINFTYQLLDMFDTAEVIFGNEDILNGTEKDIIAFQTIAIERIQEEEKSNKSKMLRRVEDGTAHFYISRQSLSHEKIFLLKSNDGNTRVVCGSANMSSNAFGGKQRENIIFVDNPEGYEHFLDIFEELKSGSTDEITKDVLVAEDIENNPDRLPISRTIKKDKIVYVEKEDNPNVEFVLKTKDLASKLDPMIPKKNKSKSLIQITSDFISSLKAKKMEEDLKTKEFRSEYPELVVDVGKREVTLNGKQYNLSPDKDDVKKDCQLFLEYMDGYKDFYGDKESLQSRYFECANWFFCSPFMAPLRDMANRNDVVTYPYPVFCLLYGQSKGGKTTFLETLLKMMIGQKPKMSAPDFTRKDIDNLKRVVKGAPIIVDDMTQQRFTNHAVETIKNDAFGMSEHLINYPAIVISANEDVKAVAPEITRRTVKIHVEAGLTNTQVMKSNIVKRVQKNIGTAFYCEYLSRMLPIVERMMETMKEEEPDAPDVLAASSKVICDIITEHCGELPKYIRELSLIDYFGEKQTGKAVIKAIKQAWRTNKKSFEVDKKRNELRYDTGNNWDAERMLKELPENLEARRSITKVVMNLDEAREYFEESFKKYFWQ